MSSIGHSAAVALAREGANVVVTGTGRSHDSYPDNEKKAGWRDIESVAEEVRSIGVKALPLVSDVRDDNAVRRMIDSTVSEFGRVDILVNNAAAARGNDRVAIVDLEDDLWRKVVDINLTGIYLASKYAAIQMIKQGNGGRIVMVSSVAGRRTAPNTAAYAVTKTALTALNRHLAIELAAHKINVNCVSPGLTDTYRMEDVVANPEAMGSLRIPMERAGTSEEMADAILFFAGPRSDYVTGQNINVDGGMVMDI
ncbi:MAG: SDR family oxidoreductase [Dehalococcoidia bacterium]|nr:SDR family oxidoreductase [Dehalococcoidia bacterium]